MTRLEKGIVWGSTAAVSVTGVAIAWMKYTLTSPEPWAVVNHPLQPIILKMHIVSAPFLVFGIGMITMRHIWPHFRSRLPRARRSGVGTALMTVPMIATGYALQALTDARWITILGYVHFVLGLIFAIAGAAHYIALRKKHTSDPPIKQAVQPTEVTLHV